MRAVETFPKVYFYRGVVDFRRWLQGLVMMIEHEFLLSPSEDALFVFVSKNRKAIKIVYWNKTGFALWTTRLEKERFPMPRRDNSILSIAPSALQQLLKGSDIFRNDVHKEVSFRSFS